MGTKDVVLARYFEDENRYADLINGYVYRGQKLDLVKEQYRSEGGYINMCEAIKGMIEDGRLEGQRKGRRKGLKEGRRKGRLEKAQAAARNMFLRGMSYEDAAAICEEDAELVRSWYSQWGRK